MARYIDADMLQDRMIYYYEHNGESDKEHYAYSVALRETRNAPTADVVEVNHGKWINTGSTQICSVCKEEQYGFDTGRYYCPNCGAKMDGGKI